MYKLVMPKLVKIVSLGMLEGSLLANSVLSLKLLLKNITKGLMRISIKVLMMTCLAEVGPPIIGRNFRS